MELLNSFYNQAFGKPKLVFFFVNYYLLYSSSKYFLLVFLITFIAISKLNP